MKCLVEHETTVRRQIRMCSVRHVVQLVQPGFCCYCLVASVQCFSAGLRKHYPTNVMRITAIKSAPNSPHMACTGHTGPSPQMFLLLPFCSAPEWSWRVWNRTWYQGPESSLFATVLTGRVKNHSFVPRKKEPSSDLMVAQCNVKRPRGLCGVATPTLLWTHCGIQPESLNPERESLGKKQPLVNKCLDATSYTTLIGLWLHEGSFFCLLQIHIFCILHILSPPDHTYSPIRLFNWHVKAFFHARVSALFCKRQVWTIDIWHQLREWLSCVCHTSGTVDPHQKPTAVFIKAAGESCS